MEIAKKHAEKIRFGIVGIANTALDFLLLFIFVGLGVDKIAANYLSTSASLVFSFFVNKSFTFTSTTGNAKKQFALFIIITLIGLWIIQPIIIAGVSTALAGTGWTDSAILFAAKIVATVASLIWNYVFYSRIVFKKIEQTKDTK